MFVGMRRAGTAVTVVMALVLTGCSGKPPARPAPPAAAAGGTPSAGPHEPTRRLTGTPLTGTTGLAFLIAGGRQPVLVDVDRGELRPLPGFSAERDQVVSVQPIPGDERVLVETMCAGCERTDLYVVTPERGTPRKIGTGLGAVPSLDGRGVWVTGHGDRSRCELTWLSLEGRTRREPRAVPCDRVLVAQTPLGLHWRGQDEDAGEVIEPPDGGAGTVRAHRIVAVTGRQVLTADAAFGAFTLTDTGTGRRIPVPRPTTVGDGGQGLLSPDGRAVAVSFEHPAWPGPRQRMDVWVLDLSARRWWQVPSMPVHAALKRTGMAWTPDGRLVLLGDFDEVGGMLALWRIGDGALSVRGIALPPDGAGGFVPVPVP